MSGRILTKIFETNIAPKSDLHSDGSSEHIKGNYMKPLSFSMLYFPRFFTLSLMLIWGPLLVCALAETKPGRPNILFICTDVGFFNGHDLSGWKGNDGFWSVEEGAIVGHSDEPIAKNEFLWSEDPVRDFHLVVDVKLTPDNRNAGIQFRSKPINESCQAQGYQADVGGGVWGKLYHEHGRKKLDWNDHAIDAVKRSEWNRYEILAVGDRIWTAINGTLCVAVRDPAGERSGKIAFQIHSGKPETVRYRNPVLTHNPTVTLVGLDEQELDAKLKVIGKSNDQAVIPRIHTSVINPDTEEEVSPPDLFKAGSKVGVWTKSGFTLEENDVVAFIGGTGMVKQMESGVLESFLIRAAGGRNVFFRDLAWQADTVYLRQRPRNFGTQAQALSRIGATIVVASFGQIEAMERMDNLPEFIKAYETLLEEVRPYTEKIVLITPYPFTAVEGKLHFPDLTRHNDAVAAYSAAISQLANRRDWISIDLSGFDAGGLTTDGIQLTPEGHEKWARAVTRKLLGETATVLPKQWEAVREKIQEKNVLWRRFWRPTNWAFLYGNRQTQPSSLDHRPGYPRWFPEEINSLVPLIEEAEGQILAFQTIPR
ncbi:MAG: hypothetical protein CMN58_03200 [Solibacterales bacterium]|nr:hypothetical protein [Bryobacterales bacterium]